ncbi:MAG: methyl-accepting chemotaxis protein [Ferrovibrio sp.]
MRLSLTVIVGITLAVVLAASGGVGYYMSQRYEQLMDEGTLQGDARMARALVVSRIWSEHYRIVAPVAQAIAQSAALRSAAGAKDAAAISTALHEEFGRGAISSGSVKLHGATVHDPELKAIGGEWRGAPLDVPGALLEPLAKREGAARMQLVQLGWVSDRGPVQTVIAPIGGLRLIGYIALHVDPLPELKGMEQQLGLNIAVYPINGSKPVLELAGIAASGPADIVDTRIDLPGPNGGRVAELAVGRDMAGLHDDLLQTRLSSFAIFIGIAGGVAGVALVLVARHLSAIRRREAEQEASEVRLRAEREEADRQAAEREAAQRREFEAEREAQEGRLRDSVGVIVSAASVGDLSRRIDAGSIEGAGRYLAEDINHLLGTTESAIRNVGLVLGPLADGDTGKRVTEDYKGLFGTLRDDTNRLAEQLAMMAGQLGSSAEQVHAAAREITEGSDDLAARTESQAASIEQAAASMHEITETVKLNADNAQTADDVASTARDTAEKGGAMVAEAVAAVAEIERSAQKIGDIVGLMDDIAFQTNLLALNASVEAARAGEAGKGFAVVAQEVRALAQRSANASREIKTLVQASNSQVRTGTSLVNKAGESLTELVKAVTQVSTIVTEIASASREQAIGLEQVNTVVAAMDEATQRNAALVEQTSASARSLSDQATKLKDLLSFFKG